MRRVVLVLAMVFAVLGLIAVMKLRTPATAEPEDPHDVTIEIPSWNEYGGPSFGRQLDISPDGKRIVYVGSEGRGSRRLFVHTLGETEPVEIPGTGAGNRDIRDPTFSPDGRYVAYWAQGVIRKTTLDGKEASLVSKAPSTRGIAWLDDNTLVIGTIADGLLKIAPSQEPLPLVESMRTDLPNVSPQVLPGNKAVLFTVADKALTNARLWVVHLETGERRQLFDQNAFAPRYVSGGRIVFGSGPRRELMAVRFDLSKLEIVGSPQPVLSIPLSGTGTGGATDYAVSETGVLVYTPHHESGLYDSLAWLGGVNLTRIHVRLKWLEELNRLVP